MRRYRPGQNDNIFTRDQARRIDDWAIRELGIPGVVLMENAGRSCAELIKEKLCDIVQPKVSIFCGTGNNGGDGFVIARHLLNIGCEVTVIVCGNRTKIRGDAKINLDVLERMGRKIELLNPADKNVGEQVRTLARDADTIVDALFGTGLSGQLSPEYCRLIGAINTLSCPTLAVDIPSGLDCDTGEPLGAVVRATWTVTFVAVKQGFLNPQTAAYTGEIFVASIGIEPMV